MHGCCISAVIGRICFWIISEGLLKQFDRSTGQIDSLRSHWAQISRKTGIKVRNPVCLPAADRKKREVPGAGDPKPHPPLDGFVLQGEIELFGVPTLIAQFTSWQGPPPPTVVIPKDITPTYHQAKIDHLRVTDFVPLLAGTSWKDFQLDQVLVIFQNAQLCVIVNARYSID